MAKDDLPIDKIKKLSEILQEQSLTEIEIESEGFKIRVRKEAATMIASGFAPMASQAQSSAPGAPASPAAAVENLFEVKSPMVGTYYASPSPDSAPFVKVGDKVKKGDPLCIIEAMKLMNELPSEVDGEVVDLIVSNSDAISFGQVLMKIRKS